MNWNGWIYIWMLSPSIPGKYPYINIYGEKYAMRSDI